MPVILFAALAGVFIYGLERPDRDVLRSPLIGRAAPAILLADIDGRAGGIRPQHFHDGKPVLVNFFASWCLPCQAEHPQLRALQAAGVRIYGIAVKDKPADTRIFLQKLGNPYARLGVDGDGRAAIGWGVYGYPESYIVDGKGIIRFKQVGDIRADQLPQILKTLHMLEGAR